ncbi:MAG: TIGR01906 family membrane protein [Chloroflexi bacterium]|nr:TIGR01906 family membrane protein [Chloroflexota bacterium]
MSEVQAVPVNEGVAPTTSTNFWRKLAIIPQWVITLTLPFILLLGSVRLVMTPAFLQLEYRRPGFPEDLFGFSTEDRLKYGPYGVRYLTNNADISYLGDLEINGEQAFHPDELQHMEDVKVVTRAAFQILLLTGALFVMSTLLLIRQPSTRPVILHGLQYGGVLTIGLILILTAAVFINWDFFFDTFHEIFFKAGTWQFSRSDTLIRLYPEQFWFDVSLVIGGLTLGVSLLCIMIPRWWKKHSAEQ